MTTTTNALTVVVVDPDGNARQESWETGDDGSCLEQLQGAVGGLVTVVHLDEVDVDMWLNDEGLYLCDPNPVATIIAVANRDADGAMPQPYFGPAVFTGGPDEDGATQSLSAGMAEQLLELAERVQDNSQAVAAVATVGHRMASAYRGG